MRAKDIAKHCVRRMHADYNTLKNNGRMFVRAVFRVRNRIIYLQSPLHRNVGDLAIAEATLSWLKESFFDVEVCEFTYAELTPLHKAMLHTSIQKGDVILLHGGGNLGTWYPNEEAYRQYVITHFSKNRILIMPQSVYIDEQVQDQGKAFTSVYSNHPDLLLCTRDQISDDIAARKLHCSTALMPDIVLGYHGMECSVASRTDKSPNIVVCLRNDRERKISDAFAKEIIICCEKTGYRVVMRDMHVQLKITRLNRHQVVDEMLALYQDADLVITDRFHGGIFAYITGTPCIVLEAADHKVRAGYEWLKRAGNITLLRDRKELSACICSLLGHRTDPILYRDEYSQAERFIREGMEKK